MNHEPGRRERVYRPIATTWRLYDGSSLAGRPLIANGTGTGKLRIADQRTWEEIRQRVQEFA